MAGDPSFTSGDVPNLDNVGYFFDRGIRYVTLTHSKDNQLGDSSYVDPAERTWNGLSPFGRQVVAEMNRQGVMIDVSHISDDTFWQVMEITKAPVIASSSAARRSWPQAASILSPFRWRNWTAMAPGVWWTWSSKRCAMFCWSGYGTAVAFQSCSSASSSGVHWT